MKFAPLTCQKNVIFYTVPNLTFRVKRRFMCRLCRYRYKPYKSAKRNL